jgi:pantoate ligase / CMP/dCMP kinase
MTKAEGNSGQLRCFKTVAGLQRYLAQRSDGQRSDGQRSDGQRSAQIGPAQLRIGFVPTMGALHAGHRSLMARARRENDLVVVSIFVNPLQFRPGEDLDRYPRPLAADQALCEAAGVDVLFLPTVEQLYAEQLYGDAESQAGLSPAQTQVHPPAALTTVMCGRSRPGHFQGVATVVTKLLSIVRPSNSYFGQKDAQQLAILRRIHQDLNLSGTIVGCPIVREPSGLALSSRNQYLSEPEREMACTLSRSLLKAQESFCQGERIGATLVQIAKTVLDSVPNLQTDYVVLVHPMTLETLTVVEDDALLAVAAQVGPARLIDNLLLRSRQPIIALDGPAGAGKSTVARRVAQELGLLYLDTGAMYRALTWFVLESGTAVEDEATVAELISECHIELRRAPMTDHLTDHLTVWVNGQDVTTAIRSTRVTSQVSAVAAQGAVRQALVRQQQTYGRAGGIVVDGRDIGTHVFPDAELKVFVTASVQERARRRMGDLKTLGQTLPSLEALERAIADRDYQDSNRAIAPLRRAEDALELTTDALTIEAVTDQIVAWYHERR